MRSTHLEDSSQTSSEVTTLFPISLGNEIKLYSNAYDYVPGQAHSRAIGALADMFRELNAARDHICMLTRFGAG